MVISHFTANHSSSFFSTNPIVEVEDESKSFKVVLSPTNINLSTQSNRKRRLNFDFDSEQELESNKLNSQEKVGDMFCFPKSNVKFLNSKEDVVEEEQSVKPNHRIAKRVKYDEPAVSKSSVLVLLKIPVQNPNGDIDTFYSFVDTHASSEEVKKNIENKEWLSKLNYKKSLTRYNNRKGTSWRPIQRHFVPSIDKNMKHVLYSHSYPEGVKKAVIKGMMRNIKFKFGSLCGQSIL